MIGGLTDPDNGSSNLINKIPDTGVIKTTHYVRSVVAWEICDQRQHCLGRKLTVLGALDCLWRSTVCDELESRIVGYGYSIKGIPTSIRH